MFKILEIFKKKQETNFDTSLKFIKNLIAKSNFDLAIKWLKEIENKEKELFNKSVNSKVNKKNFEIKENKINEIKEFILLKKEKIEIDFILREINLNISSSEIANIEKLLWTLKTNYIDKNSKFKYLNKTYNDINWKIEKIKHKLSTHEVKDFSSFIKKIDLFISLWKIELAEKWLEEIKQKESKIFNNLKNNHTISRKKIFKLEAEYKWKVSTIDKLINKIYIFRSKEIQKRKEKEKQELAISIRIDLENILKKQDFVVAKDYIEKNLKTNQDLKVIDYLNKKIKDVRHKIKKQNEVSNKNIDVVNEVKLLLNQVWENYLDNYINVDKQVKENYFWNLIIKIKKYLTNIKSTLNQSSHLKAINELKYILWNETNIDNMKLSNVNNKFHDGMTRLLEWTNINGYDFYWKIIWAEKITWDTFIIEEKKDKYWFSLWDATWHWLRAWLTVSNFTKAFIDFSKNYDKIDYFWMELNNMLKWSLKSWNFITNILFEINKKSYWDVKVVWMGHEPLFVYRKEQNIVEERRLFWLAAWIRKILKVESIKINDIKLYDWDIIIAYTDWIIEAKSPEWVMYGLNRFKDQFYKINQQTTNVKLIYDFFLQDLKDFTGRINYDDDVTIILFRRNVNKDIIASSQIENIVKNLDLNVNINSNVFNADKLWWKTKEDLLKEIEKIRVKSELNVILSKLEDSYKNWEIIKLKEECIKYVKLWYVSSKINFYLKKAILSENSYKISIKNKKILAKYNTLKSLYKRWDYKSVIKESYDVVVKNWNI